MPYDNNPTAKMGPYHMESAKQERKNLMDDNPVARTAAGNRPWISKHFKSGINYNTPVNGNAFTKAMKDAGGDYEKAKSMLRMDHK